MAEQLLERAQIGAAAEQMGREAVAQRVRRRPLRQAERAARPAHRSADDLAAQRPAAGAAEQGLAALREQLFVGTCETPDPCLQRSRTNFRPEGSRVSAPGARTQETEA